MGSSPDGAQRLGDDSEALRSLDSRGRPVRRVKNHGTLVTRRSHGFGKCLIQIHLLRVRFPPPPPNTKGPLAGPFAFGGGGGCESVPLRQQRYVRLRGRPKNAPAFSALPPSLAVGAEADIAQRWPEAAKPRRVSVMAGANNSRRLRAATRPPCMSRRIKVDFSRSRSVFETSKSTGNLLPTPGVAAYSCRATMRTHSPRVRSR